MGKAWSFFIAVVRLIIITTIQITTAQQSDNPQVEAGTLGTIVGFTAPTIGIGTTTRTYNQFLGIPYAKRATRFRPSELNEEQLSSSGPFLATRFGEECPQPTDTLTGNEMCHFINIFAPRINNTAGRKHPVLVFIHGAAFVSGNANIYDGSRLLNKDIVLVTFNYRLGVFGFLNMEMEEAPGNAALYDAITALRWVQKFISYFGGDPTNVTLAGQSSGSATVSHLLLSPLSRGLFHRAIAASGSALDVWATSQRPLEAALTVAALSQCYFMGSPINKTEIYTCLANAPQQTLINAQRFFQFLEMSTATGIGFAAVCPSVQDPSWLESTEAVVPVHPEKILNDQNQLNIPLMMGATRDDGGFALRLLREGYILPNQLMNNSEFMREKLVPTIFQAIGVSDFANTIASEFTEKYISSDDQETGNFDVLVPSLMDLLGALFFKSASYKTSKLHSKLQGNVFFYSFDFDGRFTRHPDNAGFPGGVAHADCLQYLFSLSHPLNSTEQRLSDIMVNYWVNFIYTGDPNKFPFETSEEVPEWPALNTENQYLIIGANITPGVNYPDSWPIKMKASKPDPADNECRSSGGNLHHNSFVSLLLFFLFWVNILYD